MTLILTRPIALAEGEGCPLPGTVTTAPVAAPRVLASGVELQRRCRRCFTGHEPEPPIGHEAGPSRGPLAPALSRDARFQQRHATQREGSRAAAAARLLSGHRRPRSFPHASHLPLCLSLVRPPRRGLGLGPGLPADTQPASRRQCTAQHPARRPLFSCCSGHRRYGPGLHRRLQGVLPARQPRVGEPGRHRGRSTCRACAAGSSPTTTPVSASISTRVRPGGRGWRTSRPAPIRASCAAATRQTRATPFTVLAAAPMCTATPVSVVRRRSMARGPDRPSPTVPTTPPVSRIRTRRLRVGTPLKPAAMVETKALVRLAEITTSPLPIAVATKAPTTT